ncbi:hypothetical protein ES703_119947 [subsurface metagenome]
MKEMTATWMERAGDVRDIQNVIEAEYHIVTEEPPPQLEGDKKGGEKVGAAAPTRAKAQATKQETSPEDAIEGEGFNIDLTWLKDSQKALKWTDDTTKTFLVSQYKVSPQGTLEEVIKRLTREQAEEFVNEINTRLEKQQSLL